MTVEASITDDLLDAAVCNVPIHGDQRRDDHGSDEGEADQQSDQVRWMQRHPSQKITFGN